MKTFALRLIAAAALSLCVHTSFAADNEPVANDKLAPVRAQIAAKQWRLAIDELNKINDKGSADWNNLMGYSLRKNTPPDVAGAEKFYDDALHLDPKHRGALEYSGELYLMLDDLGQAEQRLATLDKVCGSGCEELSALKKAVQNYKANGNKVLGQAS